MQGVVVLPAGTELLPARAAVLPARCCKPDAISSADVGIAASSWLKMGRQGDFFPFLRCVFSSLFFRTGMLTQIWTVGFGRIVWLGTRGSGI
jgi:hypothetical protein